MPQKVQKNKKSSLSKTRIILLLFSFILIFSLLSIMALKMTNSNEQSHKKTSTKKVTSLKIGQVYDIDYGQIKLVDDSHYVYYYDDTYYDSQAELEEVQEENYPDEIYPEIDFYEGSYTKSGDQISLVPNHEVIIQFKTMKDVKNKTYFKKIENDISPDTFGSIMLTKVDGKYVIRDEDDEDDDDETSLEISKINIPDKTSDFLANFKEKSN